MRRDKLAVPANQPPQFAHHRQTKTVGAKGRTAGKHTHLAIAAQAGRAHHWPPFRTHRLMKLKGQPKMAGGLLAPERIFPVKRWLDDQLGPGMPGQPRLAWYSELVLEAGAGNGDRCEGKGLSGGF